MSALDYFFKANLFLLLFYGCYWLLLRRHTFFGLNRAYLLGAVATSLLLPLVELPNQAAETMPVPVGVIVLPTVEAVPAVSADRPAETNWEAIGQWAYVLVAVLLLVRLGVRLFGLGQLIRRSPQELQNGFVLVQPIDEQLPTFSFFRYVVLNPADGHNELILRHELVHVRQWHSADILALEMLRAVCWLCPALWLYDRAIRQVHEFQADQAAAQSATYARFLVAYAFGVQPDSLANGFFNPSLLRQRLQMLGRRATSRWAMGKYALVLPLALGLLAMTSVPEEVAAIADEPADKFITISGRITAPDGKPLPGATIEVKGATRGTSTDLQGRYVFSHVFGKDTLVVGFVGFKNQEVPVNNRTVINVQLAPQKKKVGQGSGTKNRLNPEKQQDKRTSQAAPPPSGAVKPQFTAIHDNSPNARYLLVNDVKPRSYNAVDSMFTKGRSSIRVRGLRPFGENPLYIVDGVRTTADTLMTLNPKDIQNVEVVKSDMSAMYGKKAKDGVVIITMKKS
ncbi:TonB-dependent receptor plug [Fibrisoma limi BUZ 3]|uniref:TonB-dependent receptor plug n=1 Tax=Fibrisoma limi BUZ 3 TaxID=1185876 RepID=I2GC21_9BACT|nr:carboxypeptidase-like regulatory domain-containing protein [Fibrisoma limi]CCH51445.1 TonB-dependent receptor plug [Fibrisoma limi BUZ 3]